MTEESRALKAARRYLARGFAVVPVPAKQKGPKLVGWQKMRLLEKDLPLYFANGSNIGLINGEPSGGLTNVDLDAPEMLVAADFFLPATHLRGGRVSLPTPPHRYYICDPPAQNEQFADIDGTMLGEMRSTGTQTIVAPSIHPSGVEYGWDEFGLATEVEGPVLRAWLARSAAAALVARHWPDPGQRHWAALALIGVLCRYTDWDDETIDTFVLAGCAAAGDTETKDRLEGVRTTRLRLLQGEPATGLPRLIELIGRAVVERVDGWLGFRHAQPPAATGAVSAPAASAKPTDDELRDRWLAQASQTAHGLGEWRRYANGVWLREAPSTIEQEILTVIEAAKSEGIRPSRNLLQSVSYLGRVTVGIADERWDANADILVCKNGVLELDSGTLRPFSALDYATSAVPYDYDAEASAPTWLWFLERSVPAASDFLQEYAGYCLTTDTSLEIATWLHGPPGSGKSTFITGLEAMLGRRAGVLGLADIEKSRFALASLPGKTLIVATEQPASFIESSHILNALISGEPISIEQKYKDPYTITPRAKLCWAMNELPRVSNANSGLFRRVKVVEFPFIRVEDRDPGIKEMIREEGAGILNWARTGLARLMERRRFVIPAGVEEATAHFAATNDIPAIFIEDRCEVGRTYDVSGNALYKAYRYWCEDNGHKPASSTRIAEDWRRLGFENQHTRTGAVWSGLRLRMVTA